MLPNSKPLPHELGWVAAHCLAHFLENGIPLPEPARVAFHAMFHWFSAGPDHALPRCTSLVVCRFPRHAFNHPLCCSEPRSGVTGLPAALRYSGVHLLASVFAWTAVLFLRPRMLAASPRPGVLPGGPVAASIVSASCVQSAIAQRRCPPTTCSQHSMVRNVLVHFPLAGQPGLCCCILLCCHQS